MPSEQIGWELYRLEGSVSCAGMVLHAAVES